MTPEGLVLYFLFFFATGGIALAGYILEEILGVGGDE